jgi:hypothetical protein
MKKIDLSPICQCLAAIVLCCVSLSIQSIYPYSNEIPFVAAILGVSLGYALSFLGERRGAEYSITIVIGMFVLAWIIVPLVYTSSFVDEITRRRMWIDIFALLFIPFIGTCYERDYAY